MTRRRPSTTVSAIATVISLLGLTTSGSAAEYPRAVPISEITSVRFASREQGVAILTADDAFARELTKFDLQVRLATTNEPSVEKWRENVAGQVLDWNDDSQKNVAEAVSGLKSQLSGLRLALPDEVLLILTTGKDEADAAYTRANAIILPSVVARRTPAQLEALLLHELFHVLSRNSRDARRELYRCIGFELCEPIELPPQLRDRKMTNPDAPSVDCLIQITVNGEKLTAAPLIYATPAQFDPRHGTSLFNYLTARLLVVKQRDGSWQAAMKGDQPIVLDPRQVESFFEQVGRNTNYIMHPDEILADNFVHLVLKRQNLATPRIVEQMAKALTR
jgi:hypothetical protein